MRDLTALRGHEGAMRGASLPPSPAVPARPLRRARPEVTRPRRSGSDGARGGPGRVVPGPVPPCAGPSGAAGAW